MEKLEYLNELQVGAEELIQSYGVVGIVSLILRSVASLAAVLVMILDQTKWKSTDMNTSLLAPYLFGSLPLFVFQFLRREFGKWIALFTVVLKLFLPNRFPESLEIPGATILLIVAAPNVLVEAFRDDQGGNTSIVCLLPSAYLLYKHTKACGYKNSFTQKDKITYTICLCILYVYSMWCSLAWLFY